MKRNTTQFDVLLAGVLLLLLLPLFSCDARAYDDLKTGDTAIELIRRYESFSPEMYYENGHWYVGYGSQVKENAFPDGVTEEEAAELVRAELKGIETDLNAFFSRNGITPTQAQFDALVDFTYTLGSSWLRGNSALLKLVRGDTQPTRRETARAFGVWSHEGGKVAPGLAERRLEEAALYMDGSAENRDEFAYLAVAKRDGVKCNTDFAVYERGGVYDAFPTMFLLGYTLTGVRTSDGSVLHVGDTVTASRITTPIWEKNTYSNRFDDVREGDWYYDYVMELNEGGVVSGRGDGSFDPSSSVTVGEALKLILLAAGHEEQAATGEHWASGYADYAHANDLLSAALLDSLDAPIRRVDVAYLAARAIGFGQVFTDSPFADSDDGYAAALYEIGVLTGIREHDEMHLYPSKPLTRAEVSAIVWRLRNTIALETVQTIRYESRTYEIASDVPLNRYNKNSFSGEGNTMAYDEPGVAVLRGIDVSKHQGEIDWEKAAADGIDFAILRVGGRGWTEGQIYDDACFEEYYASANAEGLRLGYYFYSQAVTTAEAVEEADYVIDKLRGRRVDGPVVFDWETAGSKSARTNDLPVSVVCDCAVAFCERIREAGYTPMVYMNAYDGYVRYNVGRLKDYAIWYAGQYNGEYPRFMYDFEIWQYTSSGDLDGINDGVDMDLWFLR